MGIAAVSIEVWLYVSLEVLSVDQEEEGNVVQGVGLVVALVAQETEVPFVFVQDTGVGDVVDDCCWSLLAILALRASGCVELSLQLPPGLRPEVRVVPGGDAGVGPHQSCRSNHLRRRP